jgi:hypothetical protein
VTEPVAEDGEMVAVKVAACPSNVGFVALVSVTLVGVEPAKRWTVKSRGIVNLMVRGRKNRIRK